MIMATKRAFLKIVGGAGVILAAGTAGFALTRRPDKALMPWDDAGSAYDDPMRRALSYAILAPSAHNLQPWIVDLKRDTEAVLYCNTGKLLPHIDPFGRQTVIGLGCFLETLSIAASHEGFRTDIRLFPEGVPEAAPDGRPVARISLLKDEAAQGDPLFGQIALRRTNRDPYDLKRPVPEDVLLQLREAGQGHARIGAAADGDLLEQLRALTRDAMEAETKTPAAHEETVSYMRIGKSEIEANPDGISLGGPFLEAMSLVGMLSREALADPQSTAFESTLDMSRNGAMSAMAFGWIVTPGNGRDDQIAAGRAYMRQSLLATASGLAMQPMSQALEEYDAMGPFYARVHELLTEATGERIQMLTRFGYASKTEASPRWPLAEKIRPGA
jgi:hypothetical protein